MLKALFNWIADMWERDSRFRHNRAVERAARFHPDMEVVEIGGRLWMKPRPREPIIGMCWCGKVLELGSACLICIDRFGLDNSLMPPQMLGSLTGDPFR